MVKKIGEVGQEKGWYGAERSPNVVDLRPSERLKELVRHRKGMERITRPGSEKLKMPPQVYSRLFSREPLAGVRDTIGSPRTEISAWVPDMNEKNTEWEGSYSYRPSSFEQLRRGYETQPGRLVPVAEIEGLNPEFGLRPQVMTQLGSMAPIPEDVGPAAPMSAWGGANIGSDLRRLNRSRMPEFRERWRLAQMQHIAADPFGNMRYNQLMSGVPAKASAPSSAPATDISKKIQSNLGKRKGAPKPYLPGRTRMPFEVP